jgi:hypothetical protein
MPQMEPSVDIPTRIRLKQKVAGLNVRPGKRPRGVARVAIRTTSESGDPTTNKPLVTKRAKRPLQAILGDPFLDPVDKLKVSLWLQQREWISTLSWRP